MAFHTVCFYLFQQWFGLSVVLGEDCCAPGLDVQHASSKLPLFGTVNFYRTFAWLADLRELSAKLSADSQPQERAGALAFIVECCLNMSNTPLPAELKGWGRSFTSHIGQSWPSHRTK